MRVPVNKAVGTVLLSILLLLGHGLAPAAPSGGAEVWFLGHCGYAVRTSDHLLIFDKAAAIDLAFVFPVTAPGEKYTVQEEDFFRKFRVRAAFPMHARAGDAMYLDFEKTFEAKFPGLRVHVPIAMGQKFVYANGRIGE